MVGGTSIIPRVGAFVQPLLHDLPVYIFVLALLELSLTYVSSARITVAGIKTNGRALPVVPLIVRRRAVSRSFCCARPRASLRAGRLGAPGPGGPRRGVVVLSGGVGFAPGLRPLRGLGAALAGRSCAAGLPVSAPPPSGGPRGLRPPHPLEPVPFSSCVSPARFSPLECTQPS